jgi:hypothetical protein
MKDIARSALAVLGLLSGTQARSIAKQAAISLPSNNLISTKFSSWLSAFNTGDEATILDFYSTSFPEHNATQEDDMSLAKGILSPTQLTRMANWTGGFELVDLESSPDDDTAITVLLQDKRKFIRPGFRYFQASMAIDDSKPGQPITKLDLFPVPTPLKMIPLDDPKRERYEKGLQPLTPELRTKLIQNIVKVLREQHINAEEGKAKIAILERNLRDGNYDTFVDSNEFHMRLTADIRNTSSEGTDGVYINFGEPDQYNEEEGAEEDFFFDKDVYFEATGYGFGNVSFDTAALPGKTIATLPIAQLFGLEERGVRDAARAKMNSMAEADVLILDLRNCFGLFADTAAFILSYIFDEQRPLTKLVDRDGKTQNFTETVKVEEMRAMGCTSFGGRKPVYVLTNNRTMLHAEMIAYSVQKYGRGVVVGEQESTMGWARPMEVRVELCEDEFGKGWWGMFLQTLRLVHVATGWDWQDVGVRSDVVVEETVVDEHCRHKARLAAIEVERNKGIERQDEL